MSTIVIAYIPVLHQGYLNFLQKYTDAETVYLVGEELLAEFDQLRKDIRRLKPEQMQKALQALELPFSTEILSSGSVNSLPSDVTLVMPDEEIMHELAEKYFPDHHVIFDTVFLRWDRTKSLAENEVEANREISQTQFDQEMMQQAQGLAEKSSDWWRQVGGVVVKDGQLLYEAFNHHVPHQQSPYFDGDPRGNFHKGEQIDKSTAIHAEASLIVQAAKAGTSLANASIYVTTFPCPNCAKLVAYSGIKKLYFQSGYAMVDGESVLKDQGVEIIRVLQ